MIERQPSDEIRPPFMAIPAVIVSSGLLHQLSGSATKVYLSIFSHRRNFSKQAFPSLALICKETGLSRGTVQKSLKSLINTGVIGRHHFKSGRKFKSVYTIPDAPEIMLSIKPKKSARWLGQFRTKTGKFGIQPKKPNTAIQPNKSASSIQLKESAMNKTLTRNELYSDKKIPPSLAPPQGGNGVASATPSLLPSTEVLKGFIASHGREWLMNYMMEHSYPVPEWLLHYQEKEYINERNENLTGESATAARIDKPL